MAKIKFNFGTGLVLGALAGAAAVYLLNEERRRKIVEQAKDFSNKAADQLADKLEEIKKTLEEEPKK